MTMGIIKTFAMEEIKLEILLSFMGCKTAPVNFKENINKIICNKGIKIVENKIKTPQVPIAFFINKQLAKIKFNPSLKYPPTIGI